MAANHARNWDEFVAAFRDHESPTQNVVYADIDGNIGYLLACRIPIRAAGDGTSPVPGWTGTYEWSGYVPFERRPRAFNPPEGYIVSANNRIAGDGYPYRLGNGFAAPFRAVRIHEMITARPLHSADDMAAMQSDVLAVHARQLLPLLLETRPESDRAARALELLRHWDSQVVADSAPAAIFEAWYRALGRRMFQDELGEQLWPVYSQSIYFVGMALPDALRAHTQWCDDVRTPRRESCGDTMAAAFEDGLTEMAAAQHTEDPVRWKWGKVHPAVFPHRPFGDAPRFKRSIENEGDRFTVNVGSAFEWETYEQHHGAVYRQIVDLSPGARSRFIIPLGQSGDARDPHYDDLLERWRNCEYLPMTEAATGAASRLMLVP
jgi:penicillin amidase